MTCNILRHDKLGELVRQAIEMFLIAWLWFSKVEPSRVLLIARSRLFPTRTKTGTRPIQETPCAFCCLVLLAESLFSWIEESPVPQT